MKKTTLKPLAPTQQKQVAGGGSWPVWPNDIGQCPNPTTLQPK